MHILEIIRIVFRLLGFAALLFFIFCCGIAYAVRRGKDDGDGRGGHDEDA